MEELPQEEPDLDSYLSNQPNTIEEPTTPPQRKAIFRTTFWCVLAPFILLMLTFMYYFLTNLATANHPASNLRIIAGLVLIFVGLSCLLWFGVGAVVLVLKLAERNKAAPTKPKTKTKSTK